MSKTKTQVKNKKSEVKKKVDKKDKNKSSKKVHVGFLLDESGSMQSNKAAAVEGYNDFIKKLVEENKQKELKVTLGMFDLKGMMNTKENKEDVVRFTFTDEPIKGLRDLTGEDYNPHGSTPLYDAIIETLEQMDKTVADNEKAIVVILTDGHENASVAGSDKKARKMIADREAKGWAFIYLGSNQDAWAGTRDIGLAKHGSSFNTVSTQEGIKNQIRSAGSMASLYSLNSKSDYDRKMASFSDKMNTELSEDQVVSLADLDNEE